MSNIEKLQKLTSPAQIAKSVAQREKTQRRRKSITQQELSELSGISLGALRRFEQTGQISFEALVRIAHALGCETDFESLFAKPVYRTIQEVIDEQQRS